MNSLSKSLHALSLKPPPLSSSPQLLAQSHKTPFTNPKKNLIFTVPHSPKSLIFCSTANTPLQHSDIDMVVNEQGIYTPRKKKVLVLWDLDNKPPRGPPFEAANSLKQVAGYFGDTVEISAYANRHAFIHMPQWVIRERRQRKHLEVLERKGMVSPAQPYVCGVCGRKCKTSMELKKHFRMLHEREREKKLNRMRQLKGKKRRKYKERHIDGNEKYREVERELVTPRVGYGLDRELRRAGVYVRTVEDRPQAADWAVKRQMEHKMRSGGMDWLVLVSDDGDFAEMVKKAREARVGTVVIGDKDRALGSYADLWVPWSRVESGEVTREDLVIKRREVDRDGDVDGVFSVSVFDEDVEGYGGQLDGVVDEIVGRRSGFEGVRVSVFSEGEEEEWGSEGESEEDYLLDGEDDVGEEDGFF